MQLNKNLHERTKYGSKYFRSFFIRIYFVLKFMTGSIARNTRRRYLIYSEADFEVFRPAGATRFKGLLLHAKFHPNRCNG